MYKKLEWCFSYYHSTFSGSASRYQIIILFLKINFDTIIFFEILTKFYLNQKNIRQQHEIA